MGGRREVSLTFYRPVTRSDLKQERSFFRGSVSTFLQLIAAGFVLGNPEFKYSAKSVKANWLASYQLGFYFFFEGNASY